jgi:hypothetical protein
VVNVEHDVQGLPQSTLDRPVDALQERGVDGVRRSRRHVRRPSHRQADGVEAGLPNDVEMPHLEPAAGIVAVPVEGAAEADPAAELPGRRLSMAHEPGESAASIARFKA